MKLQKIIAIATAITAFSATAVLAQGFDQRPQSSLEYRYQKRDEFEDRNFRVQLQEFCDLPDEQREAMIGQSLEIAIIVYPEIKGLIEPTLQKFKTSENYVEREGESLLVAYACAGDANPMGNFPE